jgi:hypothetical protein
MKIALISCNIGNTDEIMPPVKQTAEYELSYYTENTLPFPLPNLDSRMKGKYLKTQSHKFIEADIHIWVDASIDITNKDFINTCIGALQSVDIVIERHKQRENVYDELEYIIDKMKDGDRYLLKRYARQPLYLEYEFYKKNKLPKNYPLYQCSFFARWNIERVNKIMDDWWDLILRYSNFDQTQFSFVAWNNEAEIQEIETKDLFIRMKHNGYNL